MNIEELWPDFEAPGKEKEAQHIDSMAFLLETMENPSTGREDNNALALMTIKSAETNGIVSQDGINIKIAEDKPSHH